MGVKIIESATGRRSIADETIMARVMATMAELGRPLTPEDVRSRVRGQGVRIDAATQRLAQAGLIRKTRYGYVLTAAGRRILEGTTT
jgi:Mn-dependent DtxR family transcriptional regulator